MNKIKNFFKWSRDNQANFAKAVAEELSTKADKNELAQFATKSEIPQIDTGAFVAKTGDKMSGDLIIASENSNSVNLIIYRKSGQYNIGGFISDNGQGLTFGTCRGADSLNPLYGMSNGPTIGFAPKVNNMFCLGNSICKWTGVYASRLNNGADIEIPNKVGTLALVSDIEEILKQHNLI
jgi:hypothetical protein